jgi:hypothetical protein
MKTKRGSAVKRTRKTMAQRSKRTARPVHKRVLLHPITAFLLLCVGVLVAGSTFRGRAVSYDVTATVPAPALASAAIIRGLSHEQRVANKAVAVGGECPSASYVKLYRNGAFSGASVCGSGQFVIQTELTEGANELKARAYNYTDQEGPTSPAITVYYDRPVVVVPPASPPTNLHISNLDNGTYRQGAIQEIADNPTVSGLAPPFSDITVTFYSVPSVCKTKANAAGVWSCTLPYALEPGLHHVVITAVTPGGKKLTFPTFQVAVPRVEPLAITSDYRYQTRRSGQMAHWELGLSGGNAPYSLMIDWGDGQSSQLARPDKAAFTISHAYDIQNLSEKEYVVLVRATDARDATAGLQLSVVVKAAAVPVSSGQGVASLLDSVQRWLWVVWPVYIAVLLMALSFWIGEREAYQRFIARKRRVR